MAWYLKLEHRGRDLYPKLKQVVSSSKEVYNHEQVRNEMFLALDFYVTESMVAMEVFLTCFDEYKSEVELMM